MESVRVANSISKRKGLRGPRTLSSQTFDMVLWDFYVVKSPSRWFFNNADYQKPIKSQCLQKMDFDALSEDHGFTTLHKIVCGIDLRDLDLEVQRHPHDVDKLDKYGRSPLWYAITHANTQFVRLLLQRGANPNLEGSSVIFEAIKQAQLEAVELLFTFGFNITNLNMEDLLEACQKNIGWDSKLHDHWAIESLIIRHWVDVNRQTTCGITWLMCLCSHGECNTNGIDQLIRRGAELELRNNNGETALFFCINRPYGPNLDAFLTLVHAGARLDVQDYTGATVLHHVVLLGSYRGIRSQRLLKAIIDVDGSQFDLDARDEDGYTAFGLLKKRNGSTWKSYYSAKRGAPELGWKLYYRYEIPLIRSLESFFHQSKTLKASQWTSNTHRLQTICASKLTTNQFLAHGLCRRAIPNPPNSGERNCLNLR